VQCARGCWGCEACKKHRAAPPIDRCCRHPRASGRAAASRPSEAAHRHRPAASSLQFP
jgi:hypothetical protein